MKAFYLTDPGKVRSHNEDSVTIIKNKSNEVLMAIADGMGGHRAGEVASSIAITHLGHVFADLDTIGEKMDAVSWLQEKVEEINQMIFEYTDNNPDSKGMGTTLVVCVITSNYIIMGNIGDSSGYVMKNEVLHKVTYDHTLVNLLVTTGELTEEEAEHHPRKNILMKALGANNPVEIDIFDVDMDIDALLLCSDGLTSMLANDQIEKVLNSQLDIEEKVIKLIRMSNNRGGVDNISVAYLIREGEKE